MGLRFYLGGSGSGKSTGLYRDLIERSEAEVDRNFFVIVPDQFTMQTQRELVMLHPSKGILNIDVLSFSRLAHRIFEETGPVTRPVLDDMGKSLVLQKVAKTVEDRLNIIGKNIKKNGYIQEVKSCISEFKQYNIQEKDLDEMIQEAGFRGGLRQKLEDLKILYKAFDDYVGQKYITAEETLDHLCEVADRSELLKKSVIVFDGFTGFTPLQNKVLSKLFQLCDSIYVALPLRGKETDFSYELTQDLFYLTKKTIVSLEKMAEEVGMKKEEDKFFPEGDYPRFRKAKELGHLEKSVFHYPILRQEEPPENISIFIAGNRKDEIKNTALTIMEMVREEKYEYRDLAIVTGDLEGYQDVVEELFEQYRIPYYIDTTREISFDPFIEFIRGIMEIWIHDFSYDGIFHFLRTGFTPVRAEEIDDLDIYVRSFGIRGKKGWSQPFYHRLKEDDDTVLEQRNRIRTYILEQAEFFEKETETLDHYVKKLYEFISKESIKKRLNELKLMMEDAKEYGKAREFEQIWEEVVKILEQMDILLGEEVITRKEFLELFNAGVNEIKLRMLPKTVDHVVVGDIERTRLQRIKVLFFIGVNDGTIPKNNQKGGIISDLDREFFAGINRELSPSPRMKMYTQRLYLYMNMTKPERKLFLSYSSVDQEGKSLRPAYLIDHLQKLFPQLSRIRVAERSLADQISGSYDLLQSYSGKIRDFVKDKDQKDKADILLLKRLLDRNDKLDKTKEMITEAAFFRYTRHDLDPTIAEELYGDKLYNSISRLETFAACPYSHFLKYGIKIQGVDTYDFEASDRGSFYHQILEDFGKYLDENGLKWDSFDETMLEPVLDDIISRNAVSYSGAVLYSSAKSRYQMVRIRRMMLRTLKTLRYQMERGDFRPEMLEFSFSMHEDLNGIRIPLENGRQMILRGRIDRVDTCRKEDELFVRIIDYKSGNKDFDISEFYHGLQLQLITYLTAAMKILKEKNPEARVVPAGMLFYHIEDPMITLEEALSPEQIQKEMMKTLKMKGMVNADQLILFKQDREAGGDTAILPAKLNAKGEFSASSKILSTEEFQLFSDFSNEKIAEIGNRIYHGEINLFPYEMGNKSACDYCEYKRICGFDPKIPGITSNRLEVIEREAFLETLKGKNKEEKQKEKD